MVNFEGANADWVDWLILTPYSIKVKSLGEKKKAKTNKKFP